MKYYGWIHNVFVTWCATEIHLMSWSNGGSLPLVHIVKQQNLLGWTDLVHVFVAAHRDRLLCHEPCSSSCGSQVFHNYFRVFYMKPEDRSSISYLYPVHSCIAPCCCCWFSQGQKPGGKLLVHPIYEVSKTDSSCNHDRPDCNSDFGRVS